MKVLSIPVGLRRRHLLAAAGSLALPALAQPASGAAGPWPSRPVRVVVPFPPGGSVDTAIRLMAQQLSQQAGASFTIDNRSGAGGLVGVSAVLEAPADGYTLLAAGNNISAAPSLSKAARYDPNSSFDYVARVAVDASCLSVAANSPFRTLADMLAFARAHPDRLTYGSSGNGTPGHLAMELLKHRADVRIRHVPYRGAAPALTDLIGNSIDMTMLGTAQQVAQIRSGRIVALGTTTAERFFALPDVPAIAESFAGYQSVTWLGLAARAGTPAAVVQQLSREIARALADADVQKRYRDAGFSPSYLGADELARHVAAETRTYAQLIRDAGITPD